MPQWIFRQKAETESQNAINFRRFLPNYDKHNQKYIAHLEDDMSVGTIFGRNKNQEADKIKSKNFNASFVTVTKYYHLVICPNFFREMYALPHLLCVYQWHQRYSKKKVLTTKLIIWRRKRYVRLGAAIVVFLVQTIRLITIPSSVENLKAFVRTDHNNWR